MLFGLKFTFFSPDTPTPKKTKKSYKYNLTNLITFIK